VEISSSHLIAGKEKAASAIYPCQVMFIIYLVNFSSLLKKKLLIDEFVKNIPIWQTWKTKGRMA
jgi:hypothetical protein